MILDFWITPDIIIRGRKKWVIAGPNEPWTFAPCVAWPAWVLSDMWLVKQVSWIWNGVLLHFCLKHLKMIWDVSRNSITLKSRICKKILVIPSFEVHGIHSVELRLRRVFVGMQPECRTTIFVFSLGNGICLCISGISHLKARHLNALVARNGGKGKHLWARCSVIKVVITSNPKNRPRFFINFVTTLMILYHVASEHVTRLISSKFARWSIPKTSTGSKLVPVLLSLV